MKVYLEQLNESQRVGFTLHSSLAEAADYVVEQEGIINDNCGSQTYCFDAIVDGGEYTSHSTWRVLDAQEIRDRITELQQMLLNVEAP